MESRIAFLFDQLKPTQAVERFRELSKFYFETIASYEAGLLALLQAAIKEHNRLLEKVHTEFEIAIPLELFDQITRLPELNAKTAVQIAFLMSKTSHLHGLYFWKNELLNVGLGAMLRDDLALRDRLCLISGERLGSFYDLSGYGISVREYVDAVFVSDPHALGGPIFRYDGNGDGFNYRVWRARNPKVPVVQKLVAGSTVVTNDAAWVAKQAPLHPDVNFIMVLQIESRYYRVWRKRMVPNIYLMSIRA